jgi:hypothetical protein
MNQVSSANLPQMKPGRCRYCKCTDARACEDGCSWYDLQHTVCDTTACVDKFFLARLDKCATLLRLGTKIQGAKQLSAHSEAGVIAADLLKEFRRAVTYAHMAP